MEEKIKELKEKLQYFDTRDLLGMIGIHFLTFGNDAIDIAEQSDIFNKTELMSPQKQYTYLAGLLMSTDDHSSDISSNNSDKYKKLEDDVQNITFEYSKTFMEFGNITTSIPDPDIIKRNLISMEAFTAYFDTDILRYENQTERLIKNLYQPFDAELYEQTHLVIDDYLSFFHFIEKSFSDSIDKTKKMKESMQSFFKSFSLAPDNIEEEYSRLLSGDNGRIQQEMQTTLDGLYIVTAKSILDEFGDEKGNYFLKYFSLKRECRGFMYYNTINPFAQKPLCWLNDEKTLFIVHPKFLLSAIFDFITNILENPNNKFADKYKKLKADIVEKLCLGQLKKIFSDNATYHFNVCEERGTKEHDILVEYQDLILIIEVKASKVREPFFNPQKAFIRIKDHFNSDTGIGGAYKQAILLKKLIESNNTITLYEDKVKAFVLNSTSLKKILPIVLTLSQFGGIAVNTSLLLEKEENQPYPWVCNLHDLENIVEINTYLNKDISDFISYIQWRIKNHSTILSSDELDVFEGYYLDTKVKKSTNKNLLFWPTGPSLIDKIYFEKQGIPYHHPLLDGIPRKMKIGRNDSCPCGSGKKYKKCCIDKGIY